MKKIILFLLSFLFIGCSIFNNEQAKAVIYTDQSLVKNLTFNVKLSDGTRTYNFSNLNFKQRGKYTGQVSTPTVETKTGGNLSVTFKLLYPKTKQLISQGDFTLDLQDNWVNIISFNIDTVNTSRVTNYGPWHKVLGCRGPGCPFRRSFPIEVTTIDSLSTLSDDVLYVFVSGKFINPPNNDIIY